MCSCISLYVVLCEFSWLLVLLASCWLSLLASVWVLVLIHPVHCLLTNTVSIFQGVSAPLVCSVYCLLTFLWLCLPGCECCPLFVLFAVCWPSSVSAYQVVSAPHLSCLLPADFSSCLCFPACKCCTLFCLLSADLSLSLALFTSMWEPACIYSVGWSLTSLLHYPLLFRMWVWPLHLSCICWLFTLFLLENSLWVLHVVLSLLADLSLTLPLLSRMWVLHSFWMLSDFSITLSLLFRLWVLLLILVTAH